jgi:hypothetical protein
VEAVDCVFLACLSLASSLWYLTRLGFYSDDWGLFAAFKLTPDASLANLVRSSFLDRPIQGVYSILLFRLFGLHPFGYQATNAVVLALVAVLLYLVLRKLHLSRAAALGVALVYSVLPNYSTDRFWFAAFAAPLSIAFYLLSLLIDLNAATVHGRALIGRRVGAVTALLTSVLLYEAALPFFFINPFLAWYSTSQGLFSRDSSPEPSRPLPGTRHFNWVAFLGVNSVVLVAVAIYKANTSPRLHAPRGVAALMWSIAGNLFRGDFKDGDYGLNLRAAFQAHYVDYLFELPKVVWSLQQNHPLAWLPLASLVFGAIVFLYALYARSAGDHLTMRSSLVLVAAGLVTFLIGYSTFLTNKAIQITPTGIGNRTSIAAALGVAVTAAGLFGLLASAFRNSAMRSTAFAAMLGAYAAGGFFVLSTISSFWIDAYGRELEILHDVETHVGTPPSRTTLMLGGICSYYGPAIVFESDWDLSGALRLHYGDRTLSADVLRPSLYHVTDSGLATFLYEGEDDYEFGSYLRVYDYRRKTSYELPDRDVTLRLFHDSPLDADCPPGMEGVGVRVF